MLTGPDVSRWQGSVDWPAVARHGHRFAILKATDGVRYRYTDWYALNAPAARAAGLRTGAYHFLLDHHTGAAQARFFVDTVRSVMGGLDGILCVVDVEREADGTGPNVGHVRSFRDEFARLAPGHPLIVYTGRWYWVGVMGDPHGADIGPLWHSEYDGPSPSGPGVADGPELDTYGGWDRATIWQHTSSGSCPGISGGCDLNIFYGTEADLADLAGLGATPTPPQENDMGTLEGVTPEGQAALSLIIQDAVKHAIGRVDGVDGVAMDAARNRAMEGVNAAARTGGSDLRVALHELAGRAVRELGLANMTAEAIAAAIPDELAADVAALLTAPPS